MNYHRYNAENKYIGVTETEPNDNLWTFNEPENLIIPIWNLTEWNEGASTEELAQALQELNKQKDFECYNELLKTDWYFIRKQDTGQDIPQSLIAERNAIRLKYQH